MFAAIQAIICTFIFVVFVSEAVTENRPAPCFLKETNERIRFNRAVSEDITETFSSETLKKEATSAEKESTIFIKSLNSGQIEKEDGSLADNASPKEKVSESVKLILNPVTILDSNSTKNEEEKSIEKEAEFLNKSSIFETTKEGNLTENNSSNANLTDFVQIALNSSLTEQIKKENWTEKELENYNITDSEQIITKAVNSESAKIEEGKLKDKESTLKNLTIFAQKSSSKGKKSKVRREVTADELNEEEKDEVGRAFLTAYEICKLLKGKHFIRVSGPNVKETKKCVLRELKKLETYPNEFIQYLENKEIVRKA